METNNWTPKLGEYVHVFSSETRKDHWEYGKNLPGRFKIINIRVSQLDGTSRYQCLHEDDHPESDGEHYQLSQLRECPDQTPGKCEDPNWKSTTVIAIVTTFRQDE